MAIRNPVEWGVDQFRHAALAVESAGRAGRRTRDNLHSPPPAIRHIGVADLGHVIARGLDDFAAYRTDVIFLCVLYPLVGLILARLAFGPERKPARWARLAPALRVAALAGLCCGLVTLLELPPKVHVAETIPDRERRHVLIVLDVSPSMRLKDAGLDPR